MTDRELLEAAATAAGIALGEFWTPYLGIHHAQHWNPLTDDGDAFRLAVKLELTPMHNPTLGDVHVFWEDVNGELPGESYDDHGGNRSAATRRAIVRAAAEIGKKVDAQPGSVG